MKDSQIIQNAQSPSVYGRFINVASAFNAGLIEATKGGQIQTNNTVGAVKNNYENKLNAYLNNMPAGVDLSAIPDKYKNDIQQFLLTQKHNYVLAAREISNYEVGSDRYNDLQSQMNNIKNSFTNLQSQFANYGQGKKETIQNIQNQAVSLYDENQANVNLLRSVYNEEFPITIDEYGNVSFVGDDGALSLNELPGYQLKDYKTAETMLKIGSSVYQNGVVLKPNDIMYNQYKNGLKIRIDSGGKQTLMSVINDGLVGDTKMIEDPYIAQNVAAYKNGQLSFEGLRDVVVDNYMNVLVETSKTGYRVKKGPGPSSIGGVDLTEKMLEIKKQKAQELKAAGFDDDAILDYIDRNFSVEIPGGSISSLQIK